MSSKAGHSERRQGRRIIAQTTLETIASGSFTRGDVFHDLESHIKRAKEGTRYHAPDSLLSTWSSVTPPSRSVVTDISILEISTLDGARLLSHALSNDGGHEKIGILNFASAKKPGGGFISGAQAQEESIARSSTLYPCLMTATAQRFYTLHNRDPKGGYYSHAMIYSPDILIFRDDGGGWTEPLEVDVLTSPAVNAGVARSTLHGRVGGKAEEGRIEAAMRERMARILFLFERQGVRNIVLGSFGTGVFRNSVEAVARIWAQLVVVPEARFTTSFDRIVFAVLGRETFNRFRETFKETESNDQDS